VSDENLLALRIAYGKLPRNTSYAVRQSADEAQKLAYLEAMGLEALPPRRYTEGEAALQWSYGTAQSNRDRDKAIFYSVTGESVPRQSSCKPQLSPIERVSKAATARKRAENEYRRALQACKGLNVAEVAKAAGVSRQRIYQVLSA